MRFLRVTFSTQSFMSIVLVTFITCLAGGCGENNSDTFSKQNEEDIGRSVNNTDKYDNATGSCQNNCGFKSTDCYCDSVCLVYNDCCPDYQQWCGEETVPQYTLTVNKTGQGTINMSPSYGTYDEGTEVTLIAQPYSGWEFSGWEGAVYDSNTVITITIDADTTVTAIFTEINTNFDSFEIYNSYGNEYYQLRLYSGRGAETIVKYGESATWSVGESLSMKGFGQAENDKWVPVASCVVVDTSVALDTSVRLHSSGGYYITYKNTGFSVPSSPGGNCPPDIEEGENNGETFSLYNSFGNEYYQLRLYSSSGDETILKYGKSVTLNSGPPYALKSYVQVGFDTWVELYGCISFDASADLDISVRLHSGGGYYITYKDFGLMVQTNWGGNCK